jgi:hypothetical protein
MHLLNLYSKDIQGRKKTSSTWRCSVRNVNNVCPALVRQVGSDFFPGGKDHNHGSVPSAKARMLITQEVKTIRKKYSILLVMYTTISGINEEKRPAKKKCIVKRNVHV